MAQTGLLKRLKDWTRFWRDVPITDEVCEVGPSLPKGQLEGVRDHIQACLSGKGGDVAARARAASLGRAYLQFDDQGRRRFLKLLVDEFGIDDAAVQRAIEGWQNAPDARQKLAAQLGLRKSLEAPHTELLRQFNALPQGVKFLVDLRSDLMAMVRDDPSLLALEQDLKELLASWFDIGFLELRRITWESPAAVLEKIIEYEAVHSIKSWNDLKNRLEQDRRLFGFFHPRMPEEPLIFVEVALVHGMADSVQALLDENAPILEPKRADTAIFYSISNAQNGLAGISFGNFLIKKVVDHLRRDLPNLKHFATLSPVPGFRKWLDEQFAEGNVQLLQHEREQLKEVSGQTGSKGALKFLLENDGWAEDPAKCAALKEPVMRLCAQYLVDAKRKGTRALDPVAHFHLTNGARMERLNWLGDVSPKGLKQAAGLMINYYYQLSDIEMNHARYQNEGQIAMSSALKQIYKG